MSPRFDDATLEELVGAYALDACEPDEAAAIEELLDRRPDLAIEARRMSRLVAGERIEPAAFVRTVEGDESPADDLVAAAPAFATL